MYTDGRGLAAPPLARSGHAYEAPAVAGAETAGSDIHVPFIDRASFVRNKRATGRPKDLADVEGLE